MNNVAIIPARGGSKGIPKKNLKIIGGKPLIAHSILAAINSNTVDKTYVSTDDDEIAQVSKEYGASVILRPKRISGDNASSESALLHALQFIESLEQINPKLLLFLQCTSPLTKSEDIDNCVNTLLINAADTAFSATNFYHFIWKKNPKGNVVGINHNKKGRILRQNQDKQYLENGAIYVMKAKGFKKYKHRFFGKTAVYEMPLGRSFEIDDPIDIYISECLFRYDSIQSNLEKLPNKITGIAFDFDGVFTNNKVLTIQNGYEAVLSDRSDGMGIELLNNMKLPMIVISSEKNNVAIHRCKKLNIRIEHGIKNKVELLNDWIKENNINQKGLIYVGNDINDIECMKFASCGICVADSHEDVKKYADIIIDQAGGNGAIREISDLIRKKIGYE